MKLTIELDGAVLQALEYARSEYTQRAADDVTREEMLKILLRAELEKRGFLKIEGGRAVAVPK